VRPAGRPARGRGGGRRLVLTHLDPDGDPAESVAGAQGTFPGSVTLAAPGQVIDLTPTA
jgi:ribonuclease BN (tRNA processing enzyme)